ncbi:MAG TPA: hypothetical protein VNL73_02365 [Verrucomicrobiae bacterium]|nr:hypothetical protein [Verrucomicrobiae bacterium]
MGLFLVKKPLTLSGLHAYYLMAFNKITKGVVFVRSLAFKLFTLLAAALLLLSSAAPAFALPQRYYLTIRDLDESGYPHLKAGRFVVVPIGWSGSYLLIIRIGTKKILFSKEIQLQNSLIRHG